LKKSLLYVAIAILGGILFGTVALWAVGAGHVDNPFASLEEEVLPAEEDVTPREEMREPPLEGVPGILWPAVTLEWVLDGDAPEVESHLRTLIDRDDAVGYLARLHLARMPSDDASESAVPLLRGALDLHYTVDVHRELAAALRESGDVDAAVAEYLDLVGEPDVVEVLVELGVDRTTIGEALAQRNLWSSLLEFAEEEPASSDLQFLVGRGLWEVGNPEGALPIFEELEEAEYEEASWWTARTLESLGQEGRALDIYLSLGGEGGYRAGIILERRGDLEGAARAFGSAPEPEALWRGARIWDERGREDLALDAYLQVAEGDSSLWDDAAYRAYLLLDEGTPLRDELLASLETRPAWMTRLGLEPRWDLAPELVPVQPEFLLRVDAYRDSGRDDLADLEVAIGESRIDAPGKLFLGLRYLENGEYERAVRWGSSLLRERPCPAAYRLAYPRAYRDLVAAAAGEFGVEPELIWAVMREESRFQHHVASWAGAMGLMQVMPETGREIARALGEPYEVNDLLDPETSIRYGSWYLRRMLDQFVTQDAALAAYNAGPGNAHRWLGTPLGSDPLTFPTAVTFRETRLYITRVGDSRVIYDWLYAEE